MNRLKKSHSNPSKFSHYLPTGLGKNQRQIFISKSSSSKKLNKSLSTNSKKFGIRYLPPSPVSRHHKKQQLEKPCSKISINTINMNLIVQEKSQKSITPKFPNSNRHRVTKDFFSSRVNYFKSSAMQKKKEETEEKKVKRNYFSFKPIKKLSNGQYGALYLAVDKETQFVAVLKSFNKEKVTLDFMIDEFKIQLYCKHPNILPAYGFYFGKSEVYLIMEAGSHNLYSEIKKYGYFSEKKAITYIYQVIRGLSYLHLNGVIHRDIKPQNIIICGGILKISDFGWSAITYADRKTFCGTLDYLSPEVSDGEVYDSKIDSWSVGVLLYEMLTGSPPYTATNSTNKNRLILNYENNVVYPSRISVQCQNFIKMLLQKNPQQRPTITQILRNPWLISRMEEIKKKTPICITEKPIV